jgi:hypothetical protein
MNIIIGSAISGLIVSAIVWLACRRPLSEDGIKIWNALIIYYNEKIGFMKLNTDKNHILYGHLPGKEPTPKFSSDVLVLLPQRFRDAAGVLRELSFAYGEKLHSFVIRNEKMTLPTKTIDKMDDLAKALSQSSKCNWGTYRALRKIKKLCPQIQSVIDGVQSSDKTPVASCDRLNPHK